MEGIMNLFWSLVSFIFTANYFIWMIILLAIFGWNFFTGLLTILWVINALGGFEER